MSRVRSLFVLSLVVGSFSAAPAHAQQFREIEGDRLFSGRMIVRPVPLEDWRTRGETGAMAGRRVQEAENQLANYNVLNHIWQTGEYLIQVPDGQDENQVSAALMSSGNFQYAEPDWIVFPIGFTNCPNDPQLASQWHHDANRMNSCDGWDIATGDPSVSVGLCDTGILTSHEDLQSHRLEGYNAVDQQWENSGGDISDVHPHGTMVTGCAAANGNNGVGISGVGWNLSHRMLRVSNDSSGNSSLSVLQHAARTSIESGDRVASVSYSGVDVASNLTTATSSSPSAV